MCDERFRIGVARPCARGRNRFRVAPSSTKTSDTINLSTSTVALASCVRHCRLNQFGNQVELPFCSLTLTYLARLILAFHEPCLQQASPFELRFWYFSNCFILLFQNRTPYLLPFYQQCDRSKSDLAKTRLAYDQPYFRLRILVRIFSRCERGS